MNLRPRGPKPRALPDCATPRYSIDITEVDYKGFEPESIALKGLLNLLDRVGEALVVRFY